MKSKQSESIFSQSAQDRESELKPLIGLPMRHLDRATLGLELLFGKVRAVPGQRGGVELLGEWKVEVYGPCAWRIAKPGQIMAASGDLGQSPAGDDRNPTDRSQYTRFDLAACSLVNEFARQPPVVESIEMDGVQGFTMRLSGGYTFIVFPTDSQNPTHPCYWRVIKPGKGKRNKPSKGAAGCALKLSPPHHPKRRSRKRWSVTLLLPPGYSPPKRI
jgi:hypothetical protein